ncbi:NAD(P)-dependent oxidoreductase [Clostridium transplantifaecale]|uniref:NAD(P)-dependent oxidoreductase n=1 Tax=Clostridium transplantifaecale TaxID=2479838 RepID=UPI000F635277|nr:NAD(P)-dependent oxidoreductase [Clostridium transplantifaecale]
MSRNYDIIHFEALGEEARHLVDETKAAQECGLIPADLRYLVTPQNLQEFLNQNPDEELPDIISIKTHSIIPSSYLTGAKKSIITRSAGYDHLETLSDKANITSLRNYCVNSVAQTAIKFMYAAAGLLNQYTVNAATFERNMTASFMEFTPDRVATVFGVGKIGKRAYDLVKANGLTAQAVDIREEELKQVYGDSVNFVSKEQAVKNSDIIINAMNLTRIPDSIFYNENYFSEDVLRQGKKGLIFINITRGEIAPEAGLLHLYQEGIIGGIGLDVFTAENDFSQSLKCQKPAGDINLQSARRLLEMAEDRTANIYVQPHQAFNSDLAAAAKASDTVKHMIEWFKCGKKGFEEQLPYYGKAG